MAADADPPHRSNFRRFFLRGLGILLPTVITIWILVAVYSFVDQKIATPINRGVQELVIRLTPWPTATERDYAAAGRSLEEWRVHEELMKAQWGEAWAERAITERREWLEIHARRLALQRSWRSVSIGNWAVLDLIGLLVAVVLIYTVGALLGGYLGRNIVSRAEEKLRRVPGFRQVYPYVKQVTDFLVGDGGEKLAFNRVVAVQYPRKGLWSIGLVTGDTLRAIRDSAQEDCMTVFVPSSPTPFTGYVITVPVADTIELPITIEEALRFTVSGGVIVPAAQVIEAGHPSPSGEAAEALEPAAGKTPQNKA